MDIAELTINFDRDHILMCNKPQVYMDIAEVNNCDYFSCWILFFSNYMLNILKFSPNSIIKKSL